MTELSVVLARDTQGRTAAASLSRNVHDAGIARRSDRSGASKRTWPTPVGDRQADFSAAMAPAPERWPAELFLLGDDGDLLVDELAPGGP